MLGNRVKGGAFFSGVKGTKGFVWNGNQYLMEMETPILDGILSANECIDSELRPGKLGLICLLWSYELGLFELYVASNWFWYEIKQMDVEMLQCGLLLSASEQYTCRISVTLGFETRGFIVSFAIFTCCGGFGRNAWKGKGVWNDWGFQGGRRGTYNLSSPRLGHLILWGNAKRKAGNNHYA